MRLSSGCSRVYNSFKKNGVDVFEGKGQITSPNNVIIKRENTDVEGITAKNIILATGSVPTIPQTIPYDGKFVLTSDDALKCEEVPKSIIIAGGGALGWNLPISSISLASGNNYRTFT